MADVVVTPNKASYLVGEPVVVTVAVQGAFEGSTELVDVVAEVTVDGDPLSGVAQVEVVAPPSVIEYVGVKAGAQEFLQDPVDPARWTGVAALPGMP